MQLKFKLHYYVVKTFCVFDKIIVLNVFVVFGIHSKHFKIAYNPYLVYKFSKFKRGQVRLKGPSFSTDYNHAVVAIYGNLHLLRLTIDNCGILDISIPHLSLITIDFSEFHVFTVLIRIFLSFDKENFLRLLLNT